MNELPCLKEKCLKFPVCVARKFLRCTDLYRWSQTLPPDNRIKILRSYFKKAQAVGPNEDYFDELREDREMAEKLLEANILE